MLRSRLTYANVVASLALFVALGGTSVAATSLISGSKIKQNSIPANRIKKHSLTATQVDVAKLGTVPKATLADGATTATTAGSAANAAHATTADAATHAGAADSATHATDADTVGGFAAAAFAPAGHVLAGSANTALATVQTFLEVPQVGFKLETDGVAGFDQTVVVRSLRTTNMGIIGPSLIVNLLPGGTIRVTPASSPFPTGNGVESRFIVQAGAEPSKESLVDCLFPGAGSGTVQAFCTATSSF